MEKSQKYIFLQALIITLIVFNLGIFFGYKLETNRIDKINEWYVNSELQLLDQKVQGDVFGFVDLDCDLLISENIEFADKIFEQAKTIENYFEASRLNKDIVIQHKRYDLLRTLLWANSMKIKERCDSDYHNVVYFYDYNEPTLDQKARQAFFSNLLTEIKNREGSKIILIPIAGDGDLSSIDLLLNSYGIEKLPAILIDEEKVFYEVESVESIENYLN